MSLEDIAKKMCAKGKGILAADESTGTMDKRLKSVGVESSEANRLNFRETLFSSDAMKNYIGGVILFDETIRQKTSLGISIPELIIKNDSVVGIKVDKGAKKIAGSPEETVTEGLDGLRERLVEYYKLGARFTKWRAVYNIGKNYPSVQSIKSNAHALARYAALVQEANMVPIVEPEVLMDGKHSAEDCFKKTSEVIKKLVSLILFISSRFLVASCSVWPPDKKAMPGTSLGTFFFRQSKVFFAISSDEALFLQVDPEITILGFKTVPFKETL